MNRPEPEFTVGQQVRVVLNDRNRTPHDGTIRAAVWHHQQGRYHYYLLEVGRKVSKRYLAEDLQPAARRLGADSSLITLWSDLDRLLIGEFMCWPWESGNPEVAAVWEQLTHPDNLVALDNWGRSAESFNEFARGCTLRALAECRSRAARHTEPSAAPDISRT